jgi:DNA-binding response OmpR family regulator
MKVLLVEDEPTSARVMQRLLEADGYVVRWAANVGLAIRYLKTEHFDAVLLDLGIGGDEDAGLYVARKVEREIPILIISGRDKAEVMARARARSFQGEVYWFSKPLLDGGMERLRTVLQGVEHGLPPRSEDG